MTINILVSGLINRASASRLPAALCLTIIATATLTMLGGVAEAKDLRYALGRTDTHPGYKPAERFLESVSKDTGIGIKLYSMSLLSDVQVPSGLRDGLADIGWITSPYHPAEFSEANLIASLSMLATTGTASEVAGAAMNGATMEYTLLDCADCLEQYKAQNLVYTAGASTPPYGLLCNKTVATIEGLKGKRIRSGAGSFERWADYFGATGVSIPGSDIYGALGQGVVDCTANGASELLGYRFIDVTKSITLGVPGGVYSGMAPATFNRNTWQDLNTEQRTVVLKAAAQLAADTVVSFHESAIAGMTAAKEKGLEIIEAPAELKHATVAFVEKDMETISRQFSEQYGVKNVAEKSVRIRGLIEKWKGLTKDISTDPDALAQVYWNEVFSKIDPNNYGMD